MSLSFANIAIVGLGVIGRNLALNLLDNQYDVVGFDLNTTLVDKTLTDSLKLNRGCFLKAKSLKDVLSKLRAPRVIALSVPAGKAIENVIDELLKEGLTSDDIVIDTGNSLWTDSVERGKKYLGKLTFFCTAVSGGEMGARFGPSLMASGNAIAWQQIKPMWESISAKVDSYGQPVPTGSEGEPCAAYIGPEGAGHYVKMVHNGIEYADMQLICEAYQYLRQVLNLSAHEIGNIFKKWNTGVLNSYLMEISVDILQQVDPKTKTPLVDMICDIAGQKGTGLWSAVESLQVGCPAPTITQAVFARSLSGLKVQRMKVANSIDVVIESSFEIDKTNAIEQLHDALYCSKLCAYAQGFNLMKMTASEQGWELDYAAIAKIWRAGCIIRAVFLQSIAEAYVKNPSLDSLLLDPFFSEELFNRQLNWRRTVASANLLGVSCAGLSSALNYFDAFCSKKLPSNLLQAQRDYFGSHTYSRIDHPEEQKFHFLWSESSRKEVYI
ncbi:NADP-dependent phosphogluconate dehydrogenase [Parasalinivibrio latis]|uniref:NADP-dependent phosphogluconate dehydrogenase n=1 Tax=Parasalinivibrio latis TaxID=2952610 RepID=UPI0030E3B212